METENHKIARNQEKTIKPKKKLKKPEGLPLAGPELGIPVSVRFSVDPSRLFPSELSSPSTAADELSLDRGRRALPGRRGLLR
jgi:hypothetical protein